MLMIIINNLSKSYNKDGKTNNVLNNLTYNFKTGKMYSIMGKSGVGKSTLIQILGLLDSFDTGTYYINKKSVNNLSTNELAEIRASHIGFIFQSFYLNPNLTVLENVILPLYIKNDLSKIEKYNKGKELLNNLDMLEKINYYPNELSGGEQQRVAIARALVNNPDIILADEPTGSLDKENTKHILSILKQLAKDNKCVIVVTHSDTVSKYVDVELYMKDGKIYEK